MLFRLLILSLFTVGYTFFTGFPKHRQNTLCSNGKCRRYALPVLDEKTQLELDEDEVEFFNKIKQVTAEINFIKTALGSYEDYTDKDERKSFLRSELSSVSDENVKKQLKCYIGMSRKKLELLQPELQVLQVELQRKENLLQEAKVKQLGLLKGNNCLVFI